MAHIQVIISPAKKMRTSGQGSCADDWAPRGLAPYPEASRRLADALKAMGRDELKALWRTSDRLTDESLAATERLVVPTDASQLDEPALSARLTPALLTYDGIQFRSMAPEVMEATALEWLQGHLWILSGLHGCLRPFDAVMPYRLEMGARLSMPCSATDDTYAKDLYAYWAGALAAAIEGAGPSGAGKAGRQTQVLNLASVEYAKAVTGHLSEAASCTTVVFGEELCAGRPVQRSTASKTARGSMVRWMAQNEVSDIEELRGFDLGYRLADDLCRPDTLVFMRADS